MSADPYTSEVLKLAATIEHLEPLSDPDGVARKTSRLCGSMIEAQVKLDGEIVSDLGLVVEACALGQAAASILSHHAIGASVAEIKAARDVLHAMLKQDGPDPDGRFGDLKLLRAAKDYPMRHGSLMLAFEAALEASEAALARAAS
ncbi:iron-sulfur cluster assembly scaffold protein [Woodsholea maritima]|uniref:iron-sulfur cluster assembly scaffold protein n=1 Tax=Woodsholea maritima TaxID=240237 RepID=UPI0003633449|nr:iron-sulfur cluster assembly scaffold protein [Woodsholea maritima]